MIEDLSGTAPTYFRYDIRDGVLPVQNYHGEYFLEQKDGGLLYRYKGSFEKSPFGTGWFFKWFLSYQGKKMIQIWEKGYHEYHGTS